MHSWKEKVTDKLSRLLPDSPSQFAKESPVVRPEPEATPLTKEGLYDSPRSLSSFLSSFLPSASVDGKKPKEHRHDINPLLSLPSRWRSKNSAWNDTPLNCHAESGPVGESEEMLKPCEEDEGHASRRNFNGTDKYDEATTSHVPQKSVPNITDKSSFISSDLYEFFQSSLPNIVKGCQWVLLYRAAR